MGFGSELRGRVLESPVVRLGSGVCYNSSASVWAKSVLAGKSVMSVEIESEISVEQAVYEGDMNDKGLGPNERIMLSLMRRAHAQSEGAGESRKANAVAKEDIASVGRAMYKRILPKVEAAHRGQMVVIDVNTGDYEIADDDLTATMRLMDRKPDAVTWGERIGYPAPYYISERIVHQKI